MAAASRLTLFLLVTALGMLPLLPGVLAQESSPSGSTFPDTAWDCSGWHTVTKGDSCTGIEKKYNTTSEEFLGWNPSVSKDCKTNFKEKYSYCVRIGAPGPTLKGIAANCDRWHTVKEGDDCKSIEKQYKITADEFFKWNPAVSKDCVKNFWTKYSYCVHINDKVKPTSSTSKPSSTKTLSQTSRPSNATTSSSSSKATTTTPYSTRIPVTSYNLTAPYRATALPPEHTAKGQPDYCNRWHWVTPGDTCQSILNLYGNRLSEEQLHEFNPTLGEDCDGLYAGWYLCIGVQVRSSSSIGWYTSPTNASIPAPTTFIPPAATYVQNFTAQPQEPGIPGSCQNFYQAEEGDDCTKVLEVYNYIPKAQFFEWNPALKSKCDALRTGFYYCVANFGSSNAPMPPTVTASASPTATGTTKDCRAWYLAVGSDDCASISLTFGTFSESDFIKWNPSVLSDCSRLRSNTYYCVAVPSTPPTRTAPLPSLPSGTRPTQPGTAANCTRFWLVSRDDTCEGIISATRVALMDFHAWNPVLGKDCKGLKPDWYVCVGTKPVKKPSSTVTVPGNGQTTKPSTDTTTGTGSGAGTTSASHTTGKGGTSTPQGTTT